MSNTKKEKMPQKEQKSEFSHEDAVASLAKKLLAAHKEAFEELAK